MLLYDIHVIPRYCITPITDVREIPTFEFPNALGNLLRSSNVIGFI
jgi:hypothetical protein